MPLSHEHITFTPSVQGRHVASTGKIGLQGTVRCGNATLSLATYLDIPVNEEPIRWMGRVFPEDLMKQVALQVEASGEAERMKTGILTELQNQIDQLAALASRPLMPDKLCVATHIQAGCLQQTRLFQDENQACDWLYELMLADGEFTAEELPEDRLEAIDYASSESAENSYDFQWVPIS